MTTRTSTGTSKGKGTAPITCTKCHASKIKCDVSIHRSPCSRCKERGMTDCEPIQSKRGTYDRKEWLTKNKEQRERNSRKRSEMVVGCKSPNSSSASSDDSSSPPPPPHAIEPSQGATPNERPDRNIILESFLNDRRSVVDNAPMTFFGESFLMSFLFQNQRSKRGQIRLHKSSHQASLADHPKHMTAAKIASLFNENCFSKPDCAVLNQLIMTYFRKVHPILPILDRTAFLRLYQADKVPWLLPSQSPLRYHPLRGAHEVLPSRKITFRLNDYWNTFSWLNTAVNIAESLGMHRAVPALDIACSKEGAVETDLPLRICMTECDIEHLRMDDFESDRDPVDDVDEFFGIRENVHGAYVIETTNLSMILRDIVSARSLNGITTTFVLAALKRLDTWHSSLPPCLKLAT
ncbi:hypothetical protein V1522DRAFT_425008 [Lipomyces starkeyi]